MTDDHLKKSIEDLELSMRTNNFLGSLGVGTVGELLKLPKLTIPQATQPKIAKMMVAELQEVLRELELTYSGKIEMPEPRVASLSATGSVKERWTTVVAWLGKHHPHVLEQFNPPATQSAIDEAEEALGVTFPDDYKQFLALHDGQSEDGIGFVGFGPLKPVGELAGIKIFGEAEPCEPEDVGPGVRAVDYCEKWVPISESARGRDYLCIDLDPAPGGVRGQIIEYVADDVKRPLIARSFADLISLFFERLQTGEIEIEEP